MTEFQIEQLVFGERISFEDERLLKRRTKAQYARRLREIRQALLPYRSEDLDDDFPSHAEKLGLKSKRAYADEARAVVRTSLSVLAQNYFGTIQFIFFGDRGIVVVDEKNHIRGYFPHPKPGAIKKVFDSYKRRRLWLMLSEPSETN